MQKDVWSPKATPLAEGYLVAEGDSVCGRIYPSACGRIYPSACGRIFGRRRRPRSNRPDLLAPASNPSEKEKPDRHRVDVCRVLDPRTPPRSLRPRSLSQARLWTQARPPTPLNPPSPATFLWSEIETWSTPQGWGQPPRLSRREDHPGP